MIKLAQDTVERDDIVALTNWMLQDPTPQLTMGDLVTEFEKKAALLVGRKYAVLSNSGSSANLLMISSLKLSGKLKNNITIIPNVGWNTSISPFIQENFNPIMCRTNDQTFSLDLNHLEELCKKYNPSVVMVVQPLGALADKDKLLELKDKYSFELLCDGCGAVGSQYNDGTMVGNVGLASSWSMFYGHQICALNEAGVTFTNDEELYEIMVSIRSHGWLRHNSESFKQKQFQKYNVDNFNQPFFFIYPGYNLRSTNVNSFVGLRQLEKLKSFSDIRDRNHRRYYENLSHKYQCQDISNNKIVSSISFALVTKSNQERKEIVEKLNKNGIENRLYSCGSLARHPFWFNRFSKNGKDEFGNELINDPVGDKIHDCALFVPNHQKITLEDVDYISNIILNDK